MGTKTDESYESDCQAVAKEALVLLVACVNRSWKLPIAYFLIDGMTGEQRAALILQCLERIHETGVDAVSVTFDACPANVNMMKCLGCSIDANTFKTSFKHPSTQKDVCVFLDACHTLKLVRNCLEFKKVLIDGDGNQIKWNYFEQLINL